MIGEHLVCWWSILNQAYRKLTVVLLVGHNPEANEHVETFPETEDRMKHPSEVRCEQKKTKKTRMTRSQWTNRWGTQPSACTCSTA